MFPKISLKVDTMRKPQEFVVLAQSDGNIFCQSDKRALLVRPGQKAVLSTKGNTHIDLMPIRGAKLIELDDETTEAIVSKVSVKDEISLGGGVVIAKSVIQVIG